ncbi:MAG: VOC family protein [Clostridiales bacterium]|nr:VOC family protein [Clostridiales bacterium]
MKTANYKFEHVAVPTDKEQPGETYFEELKLYCTDPSKTEYFIEYLRPAPGCTFFPVLLENPHVAYKVDNLEEALKGETVVVPPFAPWPGRMIAFVDVNGLIFELIEDE